jgi:Family of unknown function (DUF5681)
MTPPDEHKSYGSNGKLREGDYAVGKYRPPAHTQWQPGQSGNPSGRPKGRLNLNTEIKQLLRKKITIRDGETERKLSLPAANILAHAVKGAKGDVRSTALFLNYLDQKGLLEEEESLGFGGAILHAPAKKPRLSDGLFEHRNLESLSRSEQIELSRLADVVDNADGGMMALSATDFGRVKHLVNKGRGKTIVAH